jgi:hypothetical protein
MHFAQLEGQRIHLRAQLNNFLCGGRGGRAQLPRAVRAQAEHSGRNNNLLHAGLWQFERKAEAGQRTANKKKEKQNKAQIMAKERRSFRGRIERNPALKGAHDNLKGTDFEQTLTSQTRTAEDPDALCVRPRTLRELGDVGKLHLRAPDLRVVRYNDAHTSRAEQTAARAGRVANKQAHLNVIARE